MLDSYRFPYLEHVTLCAGAESKRVQFPVLSQIGSWPLCLVFIYPPTAAAGFVVIADSLLSPHVLLFADTTTVEPSVSMEGECCHILHIVKSVACVFYIVCGVICIAVSM